MGKGGTETFVLDRGGVVLSGRYRVKELIGVGAMGSVWVAEHIALKRRVVVKFHEEAFVGRNAQNALRRFTREARLLASVRHRNVTELYEIGHTEAGEPYLIMEMLQGETLARRITREVTLPVWMALSVGIELCAGLEAVHAKGVLHRDVKPENVFLHETEREMIPKLLDFGLARRMGSSGRITWTGSAVGTPGYMAPEQARGSDDLDQRVDLYALGVTLYEVLAGDLPFDGESDVELLRAAAHSEPTPLTVWRPDLAGPVSDAVMIALASKRADRYADAREMRVALEAALQAHEEQERSEGVVRSRESLAAVRQRRAATTPPYE